VRSLQAWLETAGSIDASVQVAGQISARAAEDAVGQRRCCIVKRRAAAVGLDPSPYAGHSLRARLAASGLASG
jgi:hypothetical protein